MCWGRQSAHAVPPPPAIGLHQVLLTQRATNVSLASSALPTLSNLTRTIALLAHIAARGGPLPQLTARPVPWATTARLALPRLSLAEMAISATRLDSRFQRTASPVLSRILIIAALPVRRVPLGRHARTTASRSQTSSVRLGSSARRGRARPRGTLLPAPLEATAKWERQLKSPARRVPTTPTREPNIC